jgi:DNA-directed RNA polymerase subunit E'/Rpb7
MFFHVKITQNFYISPKYFNRELKKNLMAKIFQSVEGKNVEPYGNIICVAEVIGDIGNARLLAGSPSGIYRVTYKAITFKVIRGEILDATVTAVTNLGFFAEANNLQIFVSKREIPVSFKYQKSSQSFINPFRKKEKLSRDIAIRIRIISVGTGDRKNQALGTIKCKNLDLIRFNKKI